ncbi:MAG: hypothetical protein JOZ72_08435 [Alphaproteobacteria bacterium]|nr:hypothetical protein [Alphaproteobacteria bacterium]
MTINWPLHERRARRAWPHLVKCAKNAGPTFTYGDLSAKIGVHHRAARWFLGAIQRYCDAQRDGCPLQALAVNKATGLPGTGYHGSPRTKKDHRAALMRVRKKRWPPKAPF